MVIELHKYLNNRSFKSYTVDSYNEALKQLAFPNYETFDDVNGTHCSFFQKIMTVIDKIAPYRNKRIKGNTQKWLNDEVYEKLNPREKLFKKFKKSRLAIDEELYKKAKYDASKLITTINKHSLKRSFQKQLANLKDYGNCLSL